MLICRWCKKRFIESGEVRRPLKGEHFFYPDMGPGGEPVTEAAFDFESGSGLRICIPAPEENPITPQNPL